MQRLCYLLLSIALIAACTKKRPHTETLRVSLGEQEPQLNVTKSGLSDQITPIAAPFLRYNYSKKQGLSFRGFLAETYTPNSKQDQWTFKIRDKVLWSDGTPLTMKHILDGIRYALTPNNKVELTSLMFQIRGAEDFYHGKVKDFSKLGIRVDGQKIHFHLRKPVLFFPHLFVGGNFTPIRTDMIKKMANKEISPQDFPVLGPYKIKSWQPGKLYHYERNPHFFGTEAAIPYLKILPVENQQTGVRLYEKNVVDIAWSPDPISSKKYRDSPQLRLNPIGSVGYIGFNTQMKPVDNPYLRKAIHYAIDKDEVNQLLGGGKASLNHILPHIFGQYQKTFDKKLFDLKKAKEFLQKAGYKKGEDVPTINFYYHRHFQHKIKVENIAYQLQKNLNIKTQLKVLDYKSLVDKLDNDPPQMFRIGVLPPIPEASEYFKWFLTENKNNRFRWSNKKFDRFVEQATYETNKKQQIKLYNKAMQILLEETPIIVIYSGTYPALVKSHVKHFEINSSRLVYYDEMSLNYSNKEK